MDNLLHEAIPGIIFNSLQRENQNTKIRKFASYSVFSEGWAYTRHWAKNWIVHRSLSKN
jgi:uncharacterized protein (DUF885 family)